jgi:predicted DNA-binding transcriptional regulator AlpA
MMPRGNATTHMPDRRFDLYLHSCPDIIGGDESRSARSRTPLGRVTQLLDGIRGDESGKPCDEGRLDVMVEPLAARQHPRLAPHRHLRASRSTGRPPRHHLAPAATTGTRRQERLLADTDTGQQGAATHVEPLPTIPEVTAVLGMSEGWVRQGILEGTLPSTKLGRSIRFTQAQIEAIIARGQRVPLSQEGQARRHRGSARTRL